MIQTATIAEGQSLSGAVEIGGETVFRIDMPETWDAADLTFQVSRDGAAWQNLYKEDGTEYTATAAANRAIQIDPVRLAGMSHLKVRSGTSGAAVNQTAARVLTILSRMTR